jgi:hypothetical protein
MPIAKSRFVVSDSNTAGESTASTGGTDYNASCGVVATYTTNQYGISITSETSNLQAKLAYTKVVNNLGYGVPVTVWITDGTAKAKIDFAEDYLGDDAFVLLNGKTYGFTFPATRAAAEAYTDGSPMSVLANVKTGVTF